MRHGSKIARLIGAKCEYMNVVARCHMPFDPTKVHESIHRTMVAIRTSEELLRRTAELLRQSNEMKTRTAGAVAPVKPAEAQGIFDRFKGSTDRPSQMVGLE